MYQLDSPLTINKHVTDHVTDRVTGHVMYCFVLTVFNAACTCGGKVSLFLLEEEVKFINDENC